MTSTARGVFRDGAANPRRPAPPPADSRGDDEEPDYLTLSTAELGDLARRYRARGYAAATEEEAAQWFGRQRCCAATINRRLGL